MEEYRLYNKILSDRKIQALCEKLKTMTSEDYARGLGEVLGDLACWEIGVRGTTKAYGFLTKNGPKVITVVKQTGKTAFENVGQVLKTGERVEVAGTGLKVSEKVYKTAEEIAAHPPKMEIIKDAGKGGYQAAIL